MTDAATERTVDPWAWVDEEPGAGPLDDLAALNVTAVLVTRDSERWLDPLLDALRDQTVAPTRIVVADAGSTDATLVRLREAAVRGGVTTVSEAPDARSFADASRAALAALAGDDCGEWLWLLHDDSEPEPAALERLLSCGVSGPDVGVVAPLLLQPRRRGVGTLVGEFGRTVTTTGLVIRDVAEGVLDQGQFERGPVLGASTCGLLVRRDVWEALGGLNPAVPAGVQGIELCWRARAAGHEVLREPTARLVHWEASSRGLRVGDPPDEVTENRRWGLTLAEAFAGDGRAPGRWGTRAATLGRGAVHLLGKNPAAARSEASAVRAWVGDRAGVAELRAAYAGALAGRPAPDLTTLRPGRRHLLARAAEDVAGRVSDWAASFTDHDPGLGLDHLTGDDFAGSAVAPSWRRPAGWAVALIALVVGSLAAARHLLGLAPLSGPSLLPVQATMGALASDYVAPVAGAGLSSGAPWLGLAWVASWLTFGHPDAVVTLVLLASVPVTFLLARRFLHRVVRARPVALAGALVYALVPVVSGAVGSGQVGTVVWSMMLPLLATALHAWLAEGHVSWTSAAGVGLLLVVMTALVPLTWVLALPLVGWVARRTRAWRRIALAALAPALLLLSPWALQVAQRPGRLLTGIDPTLAPVAAPVWWELLLGRPSSAGLPSLWLSAVVFGALWALAVAGAARRTPDAGPGLALAGGAAALAVLVTRFTVPVPPHDVARPQASEWVVLLAAGLILAASRGLDGLAEEIGGQAFGVRHLATYGAGLVTAAVVAVAGGWWVWAGTAPLERGEVGSVPAFIRKDQERQASRTLAFEVDGNRVAWALQEDDFGRWGQAERGLVLSGDPAGRALAESVARRLAHGTGDDGIVGDLVRLGVGHVWVGGADNALRVTTSNTPGLGAGSGSELGASWVVPGGGRVLVVTDGVGEPTEAGAVVPAGEGERTLVLAEPVDGRWRATIDGAALARTATEDGRQAFALPAAGGTLELGFASGVAWWAWVQGAGLVALALVAAPTGTRGRLAPDTALPGATRAGARRTAGGS